MAKTKWKRSLGTSKREQGIVTPCRLSRAQIKLSKPIKIKKKEDKKKFSLFNPLTWRKKR